MTEPAPEIKAPETQKVEETKTKGRIIPVKSIKSLIAWYLIAFVACGIAGFIGNFIMGYEVIQPLYSGAAGMILILVLHYIDLIAAKGL